MCSTGADPCQDFWGCSDCLASAGGGCGWCDATDTCYSGGYWGPYEVTCDDWDWYSFACDNTDACADAIDCDDCTNRPTCGWCHTYGECATGTTSGPDGYDCDDWDWTGASC